MFLTEEQAEQRLSSNSNLANRFGNGARPGERVTSVEIMLPGKNRPDLTVEDRTDIAARAELGEKVEVLAKEYDITPGNVSNIKTGRYGKRDEKKVEEIVTQVRDKALERLMASLNLLDDDKLSGCAAKDLSVIAANMGRVVDKTLPKSDGADKVVLVVYSPELRNEKAFEVKEV